MPYPAYLFFSALLFAFLWLLWISNKMGEDNISVAVCMAMGSILTIIILGKMGVNLR